MRARARAAQTFRNCEQRRLESSASLFWGPCRRENFALAVVRARKTDYFAVTRALTCRVQILISASPKAGGENENVCVCMSCECIVMCCVSHKTWPKAALVVRAHTCFIFQVTNGTSNRREAVRALNLHAINQDHGGTHSRRCYYYFWALSEWARAHQETSLCQPNFTPCQFSH